MRMATRTIAGILIILIAAGLIFQLQSQIPKERLHSKTTVLNSTSQCASQQTIKKAITANITLGLLLGGIGFDAAGRVYVTDRYSNSLHVLSEFGSNSIASPVVGTDPIAVVVDPNMHLVYVSNRVSDNISVLNGTNLATPAKTINGGFRMPTELALNPNTNRLYVLNNNSTIVYSPGSYLSVVDTFAGRTVANITLPGQPV